MSVSLSLQPPPLVSDAADVEDDPTFWAQSGVRAVKARNFMILAKSLRGGRLDLAVVYFPTPIMSPYLLSQLPHILSPIQLSDRMPISFIRDT